MDAREQVAKSQADQERQIARDLELDLIRSREEKQLARTLKGVLDQLHQQYFKKVSKADKHQHRATLFRCVDSGDGSGGDKRLVIFCRSGRYTDSTTSWPVDDNDRTKCRGVAAHVWFDGTVSFREADCEYPADGDPAKVGAYANSLFLRVEEVDVLRVKSVAFLGMRIDVADQPWGVLLLDSNQYEVLQNPTNADGRSTAAAGKRTLELYGTVIQSIITEVGR